MRWRNKPDRWRWGFALFPMCMGHGEYIWLEPFWWRPWGEYSQVAEWNGGVPPEESRGLGGPGVTSEAPNTAVGQQDQSARSALQGDGG